MIFTRLKWENQHNFLKNWRRRKIKKPTERSFCVDSFRRKIGGKTEEKASVPEAGRNGLKTDFLQFSRKLIKSSK